MMRAVRPVVILAGLILIWQAVVLLTGVPVFILPPPLTVAADIVGNAGFLAWNAFITLSEIVIGLALGIVLGCTSAILMAWSREARNWLLPVLVTTQAVPVFALAPVLVLWLGYGLWPKIAMATLIIYFPVTAAFFDGIRRTDRLWLELARTMGASRWTMLRHVRLPAALPALASGIRVAAATAPIGAVVGEWVGASAGLGYAMWHAKNLMNAPGMFAALLVLCVLAVGLYFLVDHLLRRALPWQSETAPDEI